MKVFIQPIVYMALLLMAVTACYDDKGNYSYDEVSEITAENMPESFTVVQKSDPIVLKPSFKSSTEGVIDDNPNYEFGCRFYRKAGVFSNNLRYIDINEEKKKDIYYIPDVDEGDYICWYTVKDRRTDVVTNFQIPVKVTSATYEGWMVLCDVGDSKKVRMDLVSVLSKDRITTVHDVLGSKAPELFNANTIYYDPWPLYSKGDGIWITTGSGSYSLTHYNLQTTPTNNLTLTDFIVSPENEEVVAANGLYKSNHFVITDKGNMYARSSLYYGRMFEFPANTFVVDGEPAFKVAPFIGVSQKRPFSVENANADYVALFYDKDNKRFIKWSELIEGGTVCVLLSDPAGAKFSFTTGKDMIAMVNTRFNGGVVYSVLEDAAHKRSIYGINLDGGAFSQSFYEENMNTEGFDKATQFAFHSQYPYMFYNSDNKVYCYQLFEKNLTQPLTLDGEEITLLKFNLFQRQTIELADQSDEFLEQQHYLVVGSYKKDATDDNGGILRFYKFDQATGTLTKKMEYSGFGKIRDVVYRER